MLHEKIPTHALIARQKPAKICWANAILDEVHQKNIASIPNGHFDLWATFTFRYYRCWSTAEQFLNRQLAYMVSRVTKLEQLSREAAHAWAGVVYDEQHSRANGGKGARINHAHVLLRLGGPRLGKLPLERLSARFKAHWEGKSQRYIDEQERYALKAGTAEVEPYKLYLEGQRYALERHRYGYGLSICPRRSRSCKAQRCHMTALLNVSSWTELRG